MGTVTALRYVDRSEDDRVRATLAELRIMELEDVASYIVQLEMRLESAGHLEHFEWDRCVD